jgi:hypothetical protein
MKNTLKNNYNYTSKQVINYKIGGRDSQQNYMDFYIKKLA